MDRDDPEADECETNLITVAPVVPALQDVHYTRDTFAVFKPKTPLGQMPVLELDDGTMIAQSGAIGECRVMEILGMQLCTVQHRYCQQSGCPEWATLPASAFEVT